MSRPLHNIRVAIEEAEPLHLVIAFLAGLTTTIAMSTVLSVSISVSCGLVIMGFTLIWPTLAGRLRSRSELRDFQHEFLRRELELGLLRAHITAKRLGAVRYLWVLVLIALLAWLAAAGLLYTLTTVPVSWITLVGLILLATAAIASVVVIADRTRGRGAWAALIERLRPLLDELDIIVDTLDVLTDDDQEAEFWLQLTRERRLKLWEYQNIAKAGKQPKDSITLIRSARMSVFVQEREMPVIRAHIMRLLARQLRRTGIDTRL